LTRTAPLRAAGRPTGQLAGRPVGAGVAHRPDGTFVIAVHALLVHTGGRRILVDSCMGNGRA
ncbi:hypothetical protein ACFWBA_28290, partial [Streptomyces sp. NPDC059949]